MADVHAPTASLGQRIIDELWEFSVTGAYLYVCFTALAFYKAAILEAHGIDFAPFGFAALKALICAKFMSIGHMMRLGERYSKQPLIVPVLHKSFVFLLLVLLLNAGEEVVVGLIHGQSAVESLKELGGGTRDQLIAVSILGLLVLLPFLALRELAHVISGQTLYRLYFEPRRRQPASDQS